MEESLAHYGVLGMKWGTRRQESLAYRQKAARVANNQYAQPSDRKRAQYASQSAAARITKTATTQVIHTVVRDVLTGQIHQYSSMSKAQIAKKVAGIAANTAANVAVKDALAKSATKNYTDKGKTVRGTNRSTKLITKEDAIGIGINVGIKAAYVGAAVGGMKLSQAKYQRQQNEAVFNAWGKNILPQSVNNVIWSDDDMAIIDNRRR